MKLTICQQTCHLLPQNAVFWEDKKALIIADLHIGKGTVFRKAGIPIPQGIMQDDLSLIARLIHDWKANICVIVGDLIHAPAGLSPDIQTKFGDWLQSLPCDVHLVIGNHDAALLKNLPKEWSLLHIHQEGLLLEPFYFSHIPKKQTPWFVWSGHIHPKIQIKNGYDRLVLRCFQVFSDLAILPAFGFFVGGALVKKQAGCKIYAIADSQVIEI